MTDRQTFRVLGAPYPWRTARWGRGWSYKEPKLARWQDAVAAQLLAARPRKLSGPVRLETVVWIPRPKSHLRRDGAPRSTAPDYPTSLKAGDATNHHKAIEDAMRGIVWKDDSQVVEAQTRLRYADNGVEPGAAITIERVA